MGVNKEGERVRCNLDCDLEVTLSQKPICSAIYYWKQRHNYQPLRNGGHYFWQMSFKCNWFNLTTPGSKSICLVIRSLTKPGGQLAAPAVKIIQAYIISSI